MTKRTFREPETPRTLMQLRFAASVKSTSGKVWQGSVQKCSSVGEEERVCGTEVRCPRHADRVRDLPAAGVGPPQGQCGEARPGYSINGLTAHPHRSYACALLCSRPLPSAMLSRLTSRHAGRPLSRTFATQVKGRAEVLTKRPDDVVITFAKRTALGRAKKGQLKDVPVDELLHALFKVGMSCNPLDE